MLTKCTGKGIQVKSLHNLKKFLNEGTKVYVNGPSTYVIDYGTVNSCKESLKGIQEYMLNCNNTNISIDEWIKKNTKTKCIVLSSEISYKGFNFFLLKDIRSIKDLNMYIIK